MGRGGGCETRRRKASGVRLSPSRDHVTRWPRPQIHARDARIRARSLRQGGQNQDSMPVNPIHFCPAVPPCPVRGGGCESCARNPIHFCPAPVPRAGRGVRIVRAQSNPFLSCRPSGKPRARRPSSAGRRCWRYRGWKRRIQATVCTAAMSQQPAEVLPADSMKMDRIARTHATAAESRTGIELPGPIR
jgi:hypothetical protein